MGAWLPDGASALFFAGVFGAGLVRGFAGFGLSALLIPALVTALPPTVLVPLAVCLETSASLPQIPGALRHVDRGLLLRVLAGAALGTPLGVWLLTLIPAAPLRLALAALILCLVLGLLAGFRLRFGRNGELAVGFTSGCVNGAAAVGGLVVALYGLGRELPPLALRSLSIVYLGALCTWNLAVAAVGGLIDARLLALLAAGLPVLYLGLWAGGHVFARTPAARYRRVVLLFLAILAGVAALRALLDLWNG